MSGSPKRVSSVTQVSDHAQVPYSVPPRPAGNNGGDDGSTSRKSSSSSTSKGHSRSVSVGSSGAGPSESRHKRDGSTGAENTASTGTRTPVSAQNREVHQLALKVMRLTKPRMHRTAPVSCEAGDAGVDAEVAEAILRDGNGSNTLFGLGALCTLPQSFGSIFLGEMFSSYLSLHNESLEECHDVSVTAELQTGNDRTQITDTNASKIATLGPDKSLDVVVKHEVKELGTHLLVCMVNYRTAGGDKKFFRKFFKFQVYKPLDIKTMAYNVENEVVLEARVQNITQTPMHIEKVAIHASALFEATDLNVVLAGDAGTDPVTTFDTMKYLKPQDIRQYLYRLCPKNDSPEIAAEARAATAVGKLEITWRTNLGELGRLQTNMLPRTPSAHPTIETTVLDVPGGVCFGESFQLQCQVWNRGAQDVELTLRELPEKMGNVHFCGVSNRSLPTLAAQKHMTIEIDLIALSTGLQHIRGLALHDRRGNTLHEIFNLPDVFVTS
eukprot:m.28037 g.28037  ORF g.28037 m.28037 type:complete len:497 (-) comp13519_c0_seq1:26-1516(-)